MILVLVGEVALVVDLDKVGSLWQAFWYLERSSVLMVWRNEESFDVSAVVCMSSYYEREREM